MAVKAAAPRLALTAREVAESMGASVSWTYARMADGTIPYVQIGGKRFTPIAALEEILSVPTLADEGGSRPVGSHLATWQPVPRIER